MHQCPSLWTRSLELVHMGTRMLLSWSWHTGIPNQDLEGWKNVGTSEWNLRTSNMPQRLQSSHCHFRHMDLCHMQLEMSLERPQKPSGWRPLPISMSIGEKMVENYLIIIHQSPWINHIWIFSLLIIALAENLPKTTLFVYQKNQLSYQLLIIYL